MQRYIFRVRFAAQLVLALRRCGLLASAWISLHAWANGVAQQAVEIPPPTPPQMTALEVQTEIHAAVNRASQPVDWDLANSTRRGPDELAACMRELQTAEKLLALLTRDVDGLSAMGAWYGALVRCRHTDPVTRKATISETQFRELATPWLDPPALRPTDASQNPYRHLPLHQEHIYWRWALDFGLGEPATHRFFSIVQERMARATGSPPDALADAELLTSARNLSGAWQYQSSIVRLQKLLETGLGPGHIAAVTLLRAVAYHERFLGRSKAAVEAIERAATLTKEHQPQNLLLQAHMATEYAACLANADRPAEAIPMMLQARVFFEAQQPTPWTSVMRVNYNLAGFAMAIGDYKAAIQYAERAASQARESGIPTLINAEMVIPATIIAQAQLALGDASAAQRLKEALQIPKGPEMHIGAASFALVQDSVKRADAAMLAWATEFADRHIVQYRAPLQAESALRPLMLAWAMEGYGLKSPTVREPLDKSFAISLGGRSPGTLAVTQFNLARHLADKNPSAAIWLFKRAGNLLQQLRVGLPGEDQDLYRAWLTNYEEDLRGFVAVLIDEGRLPEVEQVLALLRNEELFEYTRRSKAPRLLPAQASRSGDETALSFTPQEQAANPAMESIRRDAEEVARDAEARLDALQRLELRNTYVDQIANERIEHLQQRVHTLVDAALPLHGPTQATQGAAASDTLPAHTARLTYIVGKGGLDILVRMGRQTTRHRVSVMASALNAQIQAARAELGSGIATGTKTRNDVTGKLDTRSQVGTLNQPIDILPPLQQLHQWLIAPVLPALRQARVTRLTITPDGALRYLPFAALSDGKRYLMQTFEIQTQWVTERAQGESMASRLVRPNGLRGTSAARHTNILAVGRSTGDAQHAALPGVARELAAIRAGRRAPGDEVLIDGSFTRASFALGLQRNPAIVHIASHFVLDPAGEDKSYLVLGDGQQMSLADIKTLPWQQVRLALLSACDSAVAVGQGDGREWMGFSATLSQAGVRDVLATLWRIDDDNTAHWMRGFYQRLRADDRKRASPATLARVQRDWLLKHRGTALAHPHFWAPFVWLGS